jgi:hypothetical protein
MKKKEVLVGARGFEPPTPWSRTGFQNFGSKEEAKSVWNQWFVSRGFRISEAA